MSDSVPTPPSAAEALRLAGRAAAAARRPGEMPGWYGPAFAFAFAAYGLGIGQVIEARQFAMIGGLAGGFAALTGVLGRIAMRSDGIVRRGMPAGVGGPVALAVLAVCAASAAGMLIAWQSGGGPRWIGGAAGLAAGLTFWAGTSRLNHRVRRMQETG
ncbi:hypothetical protein [Streptomyces sp. CBMA123]|uniref:hypothetical protein n=1 Tax=Streptomyces sp. CBMA123 TaxID=1896313 RepID=UPI0016620B4F|nr:hypothetical protein [Streptomyces sp. CBMA123]MBD0691402.1 hypothetical protein [Streptomyces sp. CBMA123]